MTRSRTAEILARAGLASSELERERLKGQRDASTAQSISSTLQGLAGLAPTVVGGVKGLADEQASAAAQQSVNDGKLDALDSLAKNGSWNPFLPGALEKAEGAAGAGLEQKKLAAAAITRSEAEKTQAREDKLNEGEANRNAETQRHLDDVERAANERAAKENESQAKIGAGADAEYFDLIKKKQAHLIPDAWWDEHFPGVPKPKTPTVAAPNPMKDKREKLLDLQIEALSGKNDAKANPEPKALNAPDVDAMITKPRRAITQLKELSALADDAGIVQQAQKNLPAFLSSDQSRVFRSKVTQVLQNVARHYEGGKLTDADFDRYARDLINAADRPAVFKQIVDGIARDLESEQAQREADLAGSHYLVPKDLGRRGTSDAAATVSVDDIINAGVQ